MTAPHPLTARSNARAPAREEGIVLFLVLVLVATSIGSVYAFARVSILGISSAQQRMDRRRAELLARSSLDIAIRALREDGESTDPVHSTLDYADDAWAVLTRQPITDSAAGMEVSFRIRDAGQRIDLNALLDEKGAPLATSAAFLRDALDRVVENIPGRAEEKRYETEDIANAILDWIDADQETRLGDGEAEFYKERRAESVPIDRPLLTLAELDGIPGLDRRLLDALDAYFAPSLGAPRSGGRGGINPNTAPPHVLAMIYLVAGTTDTRLLPEDDVLRALKAREDGQLFCPEPQLSDQCTDFATAIGRGETLFPALSFRSEEFAIEVEARADDVRACVSAVYSRRSEDEGGGLLSYRLGC